MKLVIFVFVELYDIDNQCFGFDFLVDLKSTNILFL